MAFELMPLPYPKNSLSPHMSAETLDYHHGKHHKTYVDKLNKLIEGTEFATQSLETIIKKSSGPIFNNAAQVWNHNFFWNCLTPNAKGQPDSELAKAMQENFGSFDAFKEKFEKVSTEHFASGWGWLVKKKDGNLDIISTPNANNPLTQELVPLLTCDVWEHAYYIDHRNSRPNFLKAFWNLVNWEFVSKNFKS